MKDELKTIGDEFWSFTLESSPTNATLLGYHDYDAELEDLSREVEDEHIASLAGFAAAAEAIDPDPLTADERISFGIGADANHAPAHRRLGGGAVSCEPFPSHRGEVAAAKLRVFFGSSPASSEALARSTNHPAEGARWESPRPGATGRLRLGVVRTRRVDR